MIQLKNIGLKLGTKILLQEADLTIYAGEKVGLIGANGVGKTSLFKLIQGEVTPEQGALLIPQDLKVACIKQEMPHGELSAVEYVLSGNAEFSRLQNDLKVAEDQHDGIKISEIHLRLAEIDGYALPSRAEKILIGLGFTQQELSSPVGSFSGGWRMRLNLAQVLISEADLLMLDEPTNHLDLESIVWLEDWLQKSSQTIIVISHDRDFLDKIINRTIYFNNCQLTPYTGNYSAFEKLRAEQLSLQQATYEKQQRKKAHLEKFINRFKAKASKAKQAKSRAKMLEKMDWVSQVHESSPFRFEFKEASDVGNPIVNIQNVDAGYGDHLVLHNINCAIRNNDRIGLIGPNGAGKSTFIKVLAGDLEIRSGYINQSNKIKIGYFAQHQLEQLHGDQGALYHLQKLNPRIAESEARRYLGGFNFQGDRVFEVVANFSGGEKARLVLALLIYQAPNLILLDEPTNHLDMEMRDALNLALQNYTGAMILVSHDRFLLSSVTDEFWLVADGAVRTFDGDLDDYRQWFYQRMQVMAKGIKQAEKQKSITKDQTKNNVKLESDLKKIETKITTLDKKLQDMDAKLSDDQLYQLGNKQKLEELLQQRDRLFADKSALEEEMLQIMSQLDER